MVAVDGCKIKANAAKEGYTLSGVIKRLESLESELEGYLRELDKTDTLEESEESDPLLFPTDRASLKKEILRLEQIKGEMEKNSTSSYFPNDPQSRLMKGRYGSYPTYNVQAGMDAQNHMVVLAEVTNHSNDWNELQANGERIKEELGESPGRLLTDKGYANKEQIKAVESAGDKTDCLIPLQESDRIEKDRKHKLIFTYDPDKDVVRCPGEKNCY